MHTVDDDVEKIVMKIGMMIGMMPDDKNIAILETSGARSRSEKKVTALVSVAILVSLSVFAISPFYW